MMIRACLCLAGLLMAPAVAAQTLPQEAVEPVPVPVQADKVEQPPAPAIDTPAAVADSATPAPPVRRRALGVRKQPEARTGILRPRTEESSCSGYPVLR